MEERKQYYVYMLASKRNGTLYIGVTNNLFNRSFQHKLKQDLKSFTAKYGVDKLVYYEEYQYKVIFMNNNKKYSANLSQMRVLDGRRLLRMVAKINQADFAEVKKVYHQVIN